MNESNPPGVWNLNANAQDDAVIMGILAEGGIHGTKPMLVKWFSNGKTAEEFMKDKVVKWAIGCNSLVRQRNFSSVCQTTMR